MKTQINFWNGKKSLEYEAKNLKEALEKAVLGNADLSNASLWNADLWNVNLRGADLSNANLSNADLWNANLRNANLRNVNLRNVNLGDVNLRNANLRGTTITLLATIHQKYSVLIKDKDIQIGCESHSIEEWENFKQKEIIAMGGKKALVWWKEHKSTIIFLAKLHVKKIKEISKTNKEV